MRKLLYIILLISTFLISCTRNEIYEYNKKILDTYAIEEDYAIITYNGYESKNKTIDFNKLINAKIMSDGKSVELIYNTRSQKTLVGDSLYFCYEYKLLVFQNNIKIS